MWPHCVRCTLPFSPLFAICFYAGVWLFLDTAGRSEMNLLQSGYKRQLCQGLELTSKRTKDVKEKRKAKTQSNIPGT